MLLFQQWNYAQKQTTNLYNVFLEVGGIAGHYSVNFERHFYFSKSVGMTIGAGFTHGSIGYITSPRFPFRIKSFFEKKGHMVEAGAGLVPYNYPALGGYTDPRFFNNIRVLGIVGYKYDFPNSRFFLGATFNPQIYHGEFYFAPWGGMKFGLKLGKKKDDTIRNDIPFNSN